MNPFTALKNLSPFHFTSLFILFNFPPPLILPTLHFTSLCYSYLQLTSFHFTSLRFLLFTFCYLTISLKHFLYSLFPSGFIKVGLPQEFVSYDPKGASQSSLPHFLYPVSCTACAIPSYTRHAMYRCHCMVISPAIPFVWIVRCHIMRWEGRWVRRNPAVFVLSGIVLHNYHTSVMCVSFKWLRMDWVTSVRF
jgi:hypothetical protein